MAFVSWGRDPPQGGAPGALGRGPTRHGSGPQAPMRAVKDQKKYTITQSIQYTGYSIQGTRAKGVYISIQVYSIQYTLPSVQYTGCSIQGTRAKGVKGNKGNGEKGNGKKDIMSRI